MLPPQTPQQAIELTVREEWGRILAALTKSFSDLQLAEDSLQDAVARAIEDWPKTGLPRVPAAWLITTARRKAIDRLRRDARFAARMPELSHLMDLEHADNETETTETIPDKRLEMIFTCCHPALAQKTQVALTLRTLGGLSTEAIAAAFLDKPDAMAQRLVRAKHKISAAGIPYQIPQLPDLPDRVSSVLAVIYLIFNRGYSSLNAQSSNLTGEAIRLGRIMHHLLPEESEVAGLLALMLLHDARCDGRLDRDGQMIPMDAQNRHRWDQAKIAEGDELLRATLSQGRIGPYQLQAAISALHAGSPTWEDTDWAQIAALYGLLYQIAPSPVVQINHAVAVSYARSVTEAIALLGQMQDAANFTNYQPYHAVRADLFLRAGNTAKAKHSYDRAIALSEGPAERAFLQKKRDSIS